MVRSSLAALDGMSSLSRANVKLARALSDNPEAIVYNSARAAAEHEAFGFASACAEVIHNGIDAERFSFTEEARRRARQALGINPEDVLVGFVARYHPVKDHRTFFDAAKIIGERHAQVRFALFGKGISRENTELVNLVTGANLADRCILAGERADVPDLLPGFDVAVNSSLSEGFSNTVAEAMMSQVPCVATDVGDSAVIVGEFGRVVSPSAPFELAANLGDLISLPAEARRLLGENARRHAEAHFSTATADTKLRNLLERVAAPSRS
jgi:glycosyltransferase involved in cell wall biosynthesis